MEKSYKEIMPKITTFIFDIDGVLTNGVVTIFPDGEMVRNMNIKDGYALKAAVNAGFNVCIISGGTNEAVRSRFEALGITQVYLGSQNKLIPFNEYINTHNIHPSEILYMGDDIPDYPVMKKVGLPCCPKDAAPEIQKIASYVSHKKGGTGCARDVIEQVLKVQDKWNGKFDAKYD
jgi:3-deoxy-D-manno-octulosonate 8-phosphate phosphatase (KDO 8-P phosphatase)